MFEFQQTAIDAYRDANIDICKVQVSSAIEGVFDGREDEATWEALQSFAEPKYLHQTSMRANDNKSTEFFEDLHLAIEQHAEPISFRGQVRVHFHVPIFMQTLGVLNTTQREIAECLTALRKNSADGGQSTTMPHFEVETYAWNVLPQQYQQSSLASGIAEEIRWLNDLLD